jgi:hypothetical protein
MFRPVPLPRKNTATIMRPDAPPETRQPVPRQQTPASTHLFVAAACGRARPPTDTQNREQN